MEKRDLKVRTKKFAIEVIYFLRELPKNDEGYVLGKQLMRSATSIGANYRSACKGKSTADFINKIIIAEEEADECCYWLELIEEANIGNKTKCKLLLKEANELTAIFTAAGKTAKLNKISKN
jgi:four helix bundle protein